MFLQFWMLPLFCWRQEAVKNEENLPLLKCAHLRLLSLSLGSRWQMSKHVSPLSETGFYLFSPTLHLRGVFRIQAGTPRVGDLWPSIQLLVLLLKVFKIWVTTDKEDFCVLCLDIWIRERLIQNIKVICWWSDIGNIIKFPNFPIHLLPVDIWDQICHAIALLF